MNGLRLAIMNEHELLGGNVRARLSCVEFGRQCEISIRILELIHQCSRALDQTSEVWPLDREA